MKLTNVAVVALLSLAVLCCPTLSFGQGSCSWSSVGGGVNLGTSEPVLAMTVFDDGMGPALYVGGSFTSAGGVAGADRIARWDGSSWSPVGGSFYCTWCTPVIFSLAVFDDGTGAALYAGGTFLTAGGVPVNHIAKWDGTSWSPLGGGVDWRVWALAVFDDGSGPALYAGGDFSVAGGVPVNHIAKWDGTSWSALGGGWTNLAVWALAVFDDGSGPALYAGGHSAPVPVGIPANHIARWDGASWSSVGSAGITASSPRPVTVMSVFDDGSAPSLYVGGSFSTAGGVAVNNIAKWNGTSWSPVGGGVNSVANPGGSTVWAMTVFDDGTGPTLYVGGAFTSASGVSANYIAKWDGTSWSPLGAGLTMPGGAIINVSIPVKALSVFDDGFGPVLYAGGSLIAAGGVPANHFARWDCGSSISISLTQPGGSGFPVFLANTNLTPGSEYYNIFSFDLCPGGVGTGPFGGLCVSNPANFQFILDQLYAPLGTSPIHFTAPSSYMIAGPFSLPPLTVEAITFDFTGGTGGAISQVATIGIQ